MTDTQSPTVLLVEDNPDDRLMIGNAFRRTAPGIRLITVVDGEDAVQYLDGQGPYSDRAAHPLPRLVLLDLRLRRRSGFEVLKWIRSSPTHATVPVFVLTSSQETGDISQAYALGANSYFFKSSDLLALRGLVRGIAECVGLVVERPGGWEA